MLGTDVRFRRQSGGSNEDEQKTGFHLGQDGQIGYYHHGNPLAKPFSAIEKIDKTRNSERHGMEKAKAKADGKTLPSRKIPSLQVYLVSQSNGLDCDGQNPYTNGSIKNTWCSR